MSTETTAAMDEDELIRRARKSYYVRGERLVADVDQQVVRPYSYVDPKGCCAIRITATGWHEGWWSPDEEFRPS